MNKAKFLIIIPIFLIISANPAFAKAKLSTELAATYSDYKYAEPGLMNLKGNMYGLSASLNLKPSEQTPLFLGLQLAVSSGKVDYNSNGTGSVKNEDNDKQEIRFLVGVTENIFSPYMGLGFRRLVNDSAGMISTSGAHGYTRTSNYAYLPVGIGIDIISNSKINVKTKLEYDYLIEGKQTSDLTPLGGPKARNTQTKGYGYRFSLQLSTPINKATNFFIEPFYEYWNISDSDHFNVPGGYLLEPKNNTKEFGLKVGLAF